MNNESPITNNLADRILSGESEAIREFYHYYGKLFRKILIFKGLIPEKAEDLATTFADDICLKIIHGKFKNGIEANLNGWVNVNFKNMYIDWMRKNPKEFPLHNGMKSDQALFHSPEKNSFIVQAVKTALRKLPENDQEIIRLKDINGCYTYQEISEMIGSTPTACKTRHHRAMIKLKIILEADHKLQAYFRKSKRYRTTYA
jgi:RNA polymerase sigma factor (sigma-70 family)